MNYKKCKETLMKQKYNDDADLVDKKGRKLSKTSEEYLESMNCIKEYKDLACKAMSASQDAGNRRVISPMTYRKIAVGKQKQIEVEDACMKIRKISPVSKSEKVEGSIVSNDSDYSFKFRENYKKYLEELAKKNYEKKVVKTWVANLKKYNDEMIREISLELKALYNELERSQSFFTNNFSRKLIDENTNMTSCTFAAYLLAMMYKDKNHLKNKNLLMFVKHMIIFEILSENVRIMKATSHLASKTSPIKLLDIDERMFVFEKTPFNPEYIGKNSEFLKTDMLRDVISSIFTIFYTFNEWNRVNVINSKDKDRWVVETKLNWLSNFTDTFYPLKDSANITDTDIFVEKMDIAIGKGNKEKITSLKLRFLHLFFSSVVSCHVSESDGCIDEYTFEDIIEDFDKWIIDGKPEVRKKFINIIRKWNFGRNLKIDEECLEFSDGYSLSWSINRATELFYNDKLSKIEKRYRDVVFKDDEIRINVDLDIFTKTLTIKQPATVGKIIDAVESFFSSKISLADKKTLKNDQTFFKKFFRSQEEYNKSLQTFKKYIDLAGDHVFYQGLDHIDDNLYEISLGS